MKKNKNIKINAAGTESASIADRALSRLTAGQYKEAIELYKQLLKNTENQQWREALAQCYLQRAYSLAEKSMVKEAVVLWENYAQNAPVPHQGYDTYIRWLLQTNAMAKAKISLSQLSVQQLDEHYPDLASLLGLLILTEKPELEAVLPKDSQFTSHLTWVRAALSAYQNNQPAEMERALKQLPFRSAFRDFRSLLKAAVLLPGSVDQARSLLTKIPVSSPYYQVAALMLAITDDGSKLVFDLLQVEAKQRQIVGTIKNFSKKQCELLEILSRQKDQLSDKIRFNCAVQFRDLFGVDFAKSYCLAALVTYPAGMSDFKKYFSGMDEFEQCRLKALTYEAKGDYYEAKYYWEQCITSLKTQGASSNFKIALILRHLATDQEMTKESVQWLIDSLEYDPDDRESYLKILQYYDQKQQADDYKHWLDNAIKKFPQDSDLLVLAIKAALANKAFKKATQAALSLLKTDPVNTYAKQILFASHLAHARKLIKTKKFHLVDKEIQQAEKLTIGRRYQLQAQLLRGFFVLLAEDKNQGLQKIADVVQKMNDGAGCAQFSVIMEALLLNLTLAPILKALPPLAKNYQLPEQEMVKLIQLIQHYNSADISTKDLLITALDKLSVIIKSSVKQKSYSEEILLSLCQCLENIGHFGLLAHCAKIALAQWTKPIWAFYKIYADVKGQADKCSHSDIIQLQQNLEQAREQSDQRIVMLIADFVRKYLEAKNLLYLGGFNDDEDDFYGDDIDGVDELFGHLPRSVFDKLDKKVAEIMRKDSPAKVIKTLNKLLPHNIDTSLVFFQPDLFYAFLLFLAATELGIETGVTIDKILDVFDADVGSKPPSFPFF